MTQEQPITPPPELVQQWYDNIGPDPGPFESFAIAAARWGADQELEACCEWLSEQRWKNEALADAVHLRAARRPKPPSLKEQALKILDFGHGLADWDRNTLRRALEALPDD